MSRHNEHDAHRDMSKELTYWDGRRHERALIERNNKRDRMTTFYVWTAMVIFSFAAGVLFQVARGMA